MLQYSLKVFVTLIFSLIVIAYYYILSPFHLENYTGPAFLYILFLAVAYGSYKILTINIIKDDIKFTPIHIIGLFLLHLCILCIFHFKALGISGIGGLGLFFKILWFSALPVVISGVCYAFGKWILKALLDIKEHFLFFSIISTGFGLFLFISFLTIAGFFGFYSIETVVILLAVFTAFGYRQIIDIYSFLTEYTFRIENHNLESKNIIHKIQPYLLSTEFLFIVITFLLSVNLINVVRPFPIGWDDLGVYMNFPRQMANAGSVLPLGQMMSWQIFTGIGFLFSSATQAFFLNSFSGILTLSALVLFTSYFLPKRTTINIPLMVGAIYLSLPMVIFHLAKDMKLDQGLLFFNTIVLFLIYYVFTQENISKRQSYVYILIAGLLAGFSFSIKLTALLLISSIFGVIFFHFLGIFGFLGYISSYIALFTKLKLWDFLNVVYPKENTAFIDNVFIGFGVLAIFFFGLTFLSHKHNYKKCFLKTTTFFAGIIIALIPWGIFNYTTIPDGEVPNILSLVTGKIDIYKPDYTLIHSEQYLASLSVKKMMSQSGTSTNEDLGRYFGYEKGINNYLKLPWNLTMQVNQKGEFTDISYIFLALIPAILLFLPYKNVLYTLPIYGVLVLIFLMHIFAPTKELITHFFSLFQLPFGYSVIFLVFLAGGIFLISGLKKHHPELKVFKMNIIFGIFYFFLWTISSFGIVWYGMAIYIFLSFTLAFGMYYLTDIEGEENTDTSIKYFSSFAVFFIVCFYFLNSSFTHGLINLKDAGSTNYKLGIVTESEAIFSSHPEYLNILFELNIDESKKGDFIEGIKKQIQTLLESREYTPEMVALINSIDSIELAHRFLTDFIGSSEISDVTLKREFKIVLSQIYSEILNPSIEMKSTSNIYRIGTFLKYYVSENNKRLYEDSLLFQYKKYFSTSSEDTPDTIVGKIKKVGMGYLLVDLNAATIDDDPEKNLTKRYEDLLFVLTSKKLETLSNDSACLRVALETYRNSQKTQKDKENYLLLAGVNHESSFSGKEYSKGKKLFGCYKFIHELYKGGKITSSNYPFLLPLKEKLDEATIESDEDMILFFRQYIPGGYKAVFKIHD